MTRGPGKAPSPISTPINLRGTRALCSPKTVKDNLRKKILRQNVDGKGGERENARQEGKDRKRSQGRKEEIQDLMQQRIDQDHIHGDMVEV